MQDKLPLRHKVSYCRYGTQYQKNTFIWSNIPLSEGLRVCSSATGRCEAFIDRSNEGLASYHPVTAQKGPSYLKDGTVCVGAGTTRDLWAVPESLVLECMARAF